jgi:hypothetical protein
MYWRWNVAVVRLLRSDSMIEGKSEHVKTDRDESHVSRQRY